MTRQTDDPSPLVRDTSIEDAKESRSLVRAGIGGLIFAGMLLFLLWIPVMKTGEFSIGSDGCCVFVMLFGAAGVSAFCFYRAIRLRLPARSDRRCRTCGYDLRGADHVVCPECGEPPPPANQPRP